MKLISTRKTNDPDLCSYETIANKKRWNKGMKPVLISLSAILFFFFQNSSAFGQYRHWADQLNAWENNVLNASKSNYFEGEVIPYVYKLSDLTPGTTEYSFIVSYDYYRQNGGTKIGGLAAMTTYNLSRTPDPF